MTRRPSGITAGRTSFEPKVTSRAVPSDRTAETQKIAGRPSCRPSTIRPPRTGPIAIPIGPAAPNRAIAVPSRGRGVESRIAASITPVLPSWKPTRSIEPASCHGSRLRATQAKTTASTRALRTMTTFRLYLSAHTPQSGTSGAPTTKIRALNRPTKWSRSAPETPIWRQVGRREGEDLADAQALDDRRRAEDRQEDPPILDRRRIAAPLV